ncbi:SusC/RagA family TonB-linked outer membrane protein [Saccharicrinis aurantiacus]|uniref:SusC/RagA family TonB-linked outer membrane protein n=1 Tax=Saccharicrinis aurantiacus TaxID=1849719 RepID=UPI00094F56C6|nr:TonB-dependent receptor [Saccharicrinis aurantiacus]
MKRMKTNAWRVLLVLAVLFSMNSVSVLAQNLEITGVVSDGETGDPIPGVSVYIVGTTNGTITNIDGQYRINAASDAKLGFSFIGYQPQSVDVAGKTSLSISLDADVVSLDEIVAVGYGVQKKKELTGAVAQIKAEEMTKIVASDFTKSLQGQVAGVNVTESSGRPGDEANIQIRGLGSINGTTMPLYVVDGIPYQGNPNIASEDIATVDILKDGAAAAVYGTRASNGVILITTKRGKEGEMKVNFSAYYGIQNITSGTELLNSEDHIYVDEWRQSLVGSSSPIIRDNPDAMNYDSDFVGAVQNDNASIQNYNLSLSGGSKGLTYNFNTNYFAQDGILVNSGYERLTTRANANLVKGKFSAFASISMMHANKEVEPWALYELAMYQGPYRPPLQQIDSDVNEMVISGTNPDHVGYLARQMNVTDDRMENSYNLAANLKYEIMPGLSYQVNLGMNYYNYTRNQFQPQLLIYDDAGNLNTLGSREKAELRQDNTTSLKYTMEHLLNYTKTFNKHTVSALLGYTIEQFDTFSSSATKRDFQSNSTPVFDAGSEMIAMTGSDEYRRLVGKLARVQYNYDDRYLFSASVRYDGSSVFSEENRYAAFPGASVGWNISEESFMDGVESIDNLKLRGSYGEVGNQGIPSYLYAAYVNPNIDYVWGTEADDNLGSGSITRGYANPEVKWETNISRNIGVDLTMLRGKFNFTADVYKNDKKDMLLAVNLPTSSGTNVEHDYSNEYKAIMRNIGNMTNKGIELSSYYKSRTKWGLGWQVTGTFTKNINEITSLGSMTEIALAGSEPTSWINGQDLTTYMKPGYEAGAFFLIETDGVFNTQQELDAHVNAEGTPIQPNAKLGDVKLIDANGDGVIDEKDRVYQGSGMPDFEAGLIFTGDYKGFDLSMQLYYSHGNQVYNGSKLFAYANARHQDMYYMWTPANPTSDIPTARPDAKADNFRSRNDYFLEDGSFLRVRNISLGYTIPKRVFNNNIDRLRCYITAQNPLTFTKYEGYDPEVGGNGVSTRGIDKGNYPVTRKFLIGVQIDF